jgi:hypothetical protein
MANDISTVVLDRASTWKATAMRYAKKIWHFASKRAKRHPIIGLVLAAFSLLDPEDLADLIGKIETATGRNFTNIDDLIRLMMKSESISGVIADLVNSKVPGNEGVMQYSPELTKAISPKVRTVLLSRQSERVAKLDKVAPLSYSSSLPDQTEATQVIRRIQSAFGVRGQQSTLDLHAALRAFVNTPSGDIKESLGFLGV